ncbi:alpha/beta-hydrolase [Artomyces pyxidatus]|uniref:Alpha/beta-hydrolase n=1 Tax=Artomyces pyxidatus TaxID=48021 RepID=A0ACB8SVY1_9AGAM|nr:alpha/beta-hydrolase [Artomyces pyxidatus]
MSTDKQHYPQVSWMERFKQVLDILQLPYYVVAGLFSDANKGRSWRRSASDSVMRFVSSRGWSIGMFGIKAGATSAIYETWTRKNGLEVLTDEIGEGAKLHWIGSRRYDRVLLYFHGGGLCFPVDADNQLGFLLALQRELQQSTEGVGFVFLEHSFTPQFSFPTQLRQANAALIHLLTNGVSPSRLLICGDSSGANLACQLFSHVLHPLPKISPAPPLGTPFLGAVFISPWISFTPPSSGQKDLLAPQFFEFMAAQLLPGIEDAERPYVEPSIAGDAWWEGLGSVVTRILATAGEVECQHDNIVRFVDGPVRKQVPHTTLVVEKNGVHEEMLFAFGAGEGGQSEEYWALVKWTSDAFNTAK